MNTNTETETFEQRHVREKAERRADSDRKLVKIAEIVGALPGSWSLVASRDDMDGIVYRATAKRIADGLALFIGFGSWGGNNGRVRVSYDEPRTPSGEPAVYFRTESPRPACTFDPSRPVQTIARQIARAVIEPSEEHHKRALKNLEADKVSRALGYALYVTACEALGQVPTPEAEAFKKYGRDTEYVGGWRIERRGTAKLEHGLIVSDPVKLRKIIKALAEIAAGRRKPEPETEKEEG